MKSFFSYVIAGIVGGVITLVGVAYFNYQSNHFEAAKLKYVNFSNSTTPSKFLDGVREENDVSNTTELSTNNHELPSEEFTEKFPFNFSHAAKVAKPVVVLIQANISPQLASEQRKKMRENHPFRRFFDMDIFGGDSFFFNPFSQITPPGTGSGVIIRSDGYIVTNNHVVQDYDEIRVTLYDGTDYPAEIVGRDPGTDLAVIKIEASNLPTIEYADSDKLEIGEWVLAVGNPYEKLSSTVTAGIVSAKGRNLNLLEGESTIEEFIQTDAAVNPGNSGGALVDADGKLVGINTAIYSQTGSYVGYSFAIPSNLMTRIVKDIMENGDIKRASMGLSVLELNSEVAEELELDVTTGLMVDQVDDRSAAQYAGIVPNDIITEVNGKKIKTFEDLKQIMDYSKVGDTLKVKLWRNGELKSLAVRLKSRL